MTHTMEGASYRKPHQWWADLSDHGQYLIDVLCNRDAPPYEREATRVPFAENTTGWTDLV